MADPAGRFVSLADVRSKIGTQCLARIYDDHNVGAEDASAVQLLIDDCESKVIAAAVTEYPIGNLPATRTEALATNGGKLLRTLTLDLVKAEAFGRHPELSKLDPAELMKSALGEIKKLALAEYKLEGIGVEPANVGGEVIPDDDNSEEPVSYWGEGTGIF